MLIEEILLRLVMGTLGVFMVVGAFAFEVSSLYMIGEILGGVIMCVLSCKWRK